MSAAYLPPQATIEQSCQWLEVQTGERWTLPRLLEHGAMPWFWLDYQPEWPAEVFNGRTEGFLAPICFASGDLPRLAVDCQDAMVTVSRNPDGMLFRLTPGIQFPVAALRFLRADVQRVAESFAMRSSEGPPATKPADDAGHDDQPYPEDTADDAGLAALFDPVKVAQLQAMFPDDDWSKYAKYARRNGLKAARTDRRAEFNPYKAAVWWLREKASDAWTFDRCLRTLANKCLPERSRDSKHLLTGKFD